MLHFLLLTSFLFSAAAHIRHLQNDPCIVGGCEADIEDFPYQVAIIMNRNIWCGGSILTVAFVLSAAHCIFDTTSQLVVHAGSSFWANPATIHHVNYNLTISDSPGTDITLLRVIELFVFDATHKPIPLAPVNSRPIPGQKGITTGWGTTGTGLSQRLMAVQVPIVNTKACNASYKGQVFLSEICAGVAGKDSCQGDSGGPLVVNGIQVGIVASGKGCGVKGYPGIYTSIGYFHDWIMEHISH